jgi:hypothetical protein
MEWIVLAGCGVFWFLRSRVGWFRPRYEKLGIRYGRAMRSAYAMIQNGTHVSNPNQFAYYLEMAASVERTLPTLDKIEASLCAAYVAHNKLVPASALEAVNKEVDLLNDIAEAFFDTPRPTSW